MDRTKTSAEAIQILRRVLQEMDTLPLDEVEAECDPFLLDAVATFDEMDRIARIVVEREKKEPASTAMLAG